MEEKNQIIFIQLTPAAFQEALDKASVCGAVRAMQLCGVPVRDMLSRAELSKRFGKGKIDRLHREGKLTPHQIDGGRPKYKLNEVLTLIN